MDRRELCFILALVGGILSIAGSLMMGLMMMLMFGFTAGPMMGGVMTGGAFPASLMMGFAAWMLLLGVANGIVMLVGATRARRPGQERSGATWALVGGGIVGVVAGNPLAGGLGIVGGALLLVENAPRAPA
ncbi:MAG TPA: hypothetical protein VM582_08495 [Candidatus Thermoplasmatota archaeon]|nr:hypothetical protein [Candidatus Thermoplasmatota archaeon]